MKNHSLLRIVEYSLEELLTALPVMPHDSLERSYAEVLVAYLSSNNLQLRKIVTTLLQNENSKNEPYQLVLKLRLAIREHALNLEFIESCQVSLKNASNSIWEAELAFLCGIAWSEISEHKKSLEAYSMALNLYSLLGCSRKALKARFNIIVSESRNEPEKKQITEYLHFSRMAQEAGEISLAGTAYLNVSREYQKLKATLASLQYVNRAIEFMESDLGTYQYEHALLHKCHVLIDLGRFIEARVIYENLLHSTFKEIQSGISIIDHLLAKKAENDTFGFKYLSTLSHTWKERLEEDLCQINQSANTLTQMETQLLELLSTGPKTKFELIDSLYPVAEAPFPHLEDRFKNLMMRLRKKIPNQVELTYGKYLLKDISNINPKKIDQEKELN